MKTLTVNGKKTNTAAETIEALLKELNVPRQGLAVAVNSEIVPKTIHATCPIKDGDNIEIMRPIGGG
jgi:sulfur carrier protein